MQSHRSSLSLLKSCSSLNIFCLKRCISVSGNPVADRALNAVTGGRIESWLQKYEDLVGLTEVKEAQNKVMQAEDVFQRAQADRRAKQQQITMLHSKLKELHAALDKVQRGEERYLALLTEEYEVLREEKRVSMSLNEAEREERDGFTALSSAVRESHERERARAERTKYWSIIGSVIGATIGIVGSTVNNYRRNRELRSLVYDSAAGGMDLKSSVSELVSATRQQQDQLKKFLSSSSDLTNVHTVSQPGEDVNKVIDAFSASHSKVEKDLSDVKRMIAALSIPSVGEGNTSESSVVYVGPEMKDILQLTENNISLAVKRNIALSSAVLYLGGVVTAGILYGVVRVYKL